MKKAITNCMFSAGLLILFILYTVAIMSIDVQPIGPQGSAVGFATINGWLHRIIGSNMQLYTFTDWASIAAILIALGFAVLGFFQLIQRKSLFRVDKSILALGVFYVLVLSAYLFFEFQVINYRPILIEGRLEASYPSSTTMLVMCIMPTAMVQFNRLIKNKTARHITVVLCGLFTAFMLIGRLLSGVHWFTDICGGALLSTALVMLYLAADKWFIFKAAAH